LIFTDEDKRKIIDGAGAPGFKVESLPENYNNILSFLKKNLDGANDKEDVFDFSIDAINRMGFEFSFIAMFREDRRYSSAVRIRVDSELVSKVEDFAQKMMPDMTVMRYRIPIYEEGRIYRRFLLESKKPLVTTSVGFSGSPDVVSEDISEMYDNLLPKDSPIGILMPALKRIVPYKYAMSAHIFINEAAVGNIGIASAREMKEEDLNMLLLIACSIAGALEKVGFGKNYA